MGNEICLSPDDSVEQGPVWILFLLCIWIVAINDVGGQTLLVVVVLTGGEPLKRANSNVRIRNASENSSGFDTVADHLVAACHCGERARRRHTEGGHRF